MSLKHILPLKSHHRLKRFFHQEPWQQKELIKFGWDSGRSHRPRNLPPGSRSKWTNWLSEKEDRLEQRKYEKNRVAAVERESSEAEQRGCHNLDFTFFCKQCAGSPKKLRFKFKPRSYMPYIPDEYETCIGGCDPDFLETLDIRPITSQNRNGVQGTQERPRATNSSHDSGYSSQQNTLSNRNQTRIVFGRNNSVAYSSNTAPFNQRTHNPSHPNDYRRNSAFNSQTNNQSYNSSYNSPNSSSFSGAGTQNTNNNRSVNNNSGHSSSYVRPSWNGGGNTERENAIVCTCNEDAILLTVRKEGPNTGRQFYKCAKPQGTGCNFFLWADEGDNVGSGGWGDDGGAGAAVEGETILDKAEEVVTFHLLKTHLGITEGLTQNYLQTSAFTLRRRYRSN
ncbi:DNA topoisomerase 3-alpha-like [Macrobrachium rosenbergii]|uniref:DNA topoisomerase 3-alpha-like n=1 Tax=Macrobrachium rosenbergii TaxID=79674 RepID=UPI0034D6CED7